MPSFGGEVKPSVQCRRFVACKRSLNGVEKVSFWQKYQTPFSPIVPLLLLGALALLGTWRHLAAKVGTSKCRGKQWQTTRMNLPRMHALCQSHTGCLTGLWFLPKPTKGLNTNLLLLLLHILISGSRSPSPVKNESVAGSRSPSPAKSKSRSPSPHDDDAHSNSGSERSARGSDNEDKVSVKSGADDDKSGLFMNYELVGSRVIFVMPLSSFF
jgi:hypothetical protein